MRTAFTACVYVRHKEKYLLIHHKRFNNWLPVGGELNPGETPQEGARRELYEETGLVVSSFPKLKNAMPGSPDGLIGYEEHDAGDKGWHMNFCFVADVDSSEIISDGSFYDHKWVTFEEAKQMNLFPNVIHSLTLIEYTVP